MIFGLFPYSIKWGISVEFDVINLCCAVYLAPKPSLTICLDYWICTRPKIQTSPFQPAGWPELL